VSSSIYRRASVLLAPLFAALRVGRRRPFHRKPRQMSPWATLGAKRTLILRWNLRNPMSMEPNGVVEVT